MEHKITDFINPRRIKWTIYGSFIQIAGVFALIIFHNIEIIIFPINPNYLLLYGLLMSFLSINNTRTKYEKLDVALSVQPVYCPHCTSKKKAMIPTEYKCPVCNAISKKN